MLMGLIWTAMIVVSVLFGCLNGTVGQVQQAALDARQAACDALGCADTYVRNKPWHSVGAAAAVGVFIGVLLNLRR